MNEMDGKQLWICWIQTKQFHEFYRRVQQFQKCIPQRKVVPSATVYINCEPDLNLIKFEGKEEANELQIKTDIEDPGLNAVKGENVEMALQASSSDDSSSECEANERETNQTDGNTISKSKANKTERSYNNPELEARIYELFTMKCDICPGVVPFETLSDARKHYRVVHKSRSYLICCDKKFYRRFAILNHVRWHTDADAYTCDICNRRFWSKYALKSHLEYHTPYESRLFKCDLCQRRFLKEHQLKTHLELKHGSTEGKEHHCEKCGKNFPTKFQFYIHNRQIHELAADYVCDVCARIYIHRVG